MKKTPISTTVFFMMSAALVCAALETSDAAAQSKAKPATKEPAQALPKREKISWGSPKAVAVGKSLRDKSYDECLEILRKRFTKEELQELTASCGSLPVLQKDWSEPAFCLFSTIAEFCIASGDREGLVTLLSNRCPAHWVQRRHRVCLVPP